MSGFAVVDLETTGLSPRLHDRIVEIAIVQMTTAGEVENEWTTLINPMRDIGPTSIHGIAARDILSAPTFAEVIPDVLSLLAGRALAAHNASFDLRFLDAELATAGVPASLHRGCVTCTMNLASYFLPSSARGLRSCCEAARIDHRNAHSALGDARATAALLAFYIRAAPSAPEWSQLTSRAAIEHVWPRFSVADSRARIVRRPDSSAQPEPSAWLDRLVADLPRVPHPPQANDYLAILDRALLDRYLSSHEQDELIAAAQELGLTRAQVDTLHRNYLGALSDLAMADGVVTEPERADLERVAQLVGLAANDVNAALASSTSEPTTPPAAFALKEGDRVTLTGEMKRSRDYWTLRAESAGLVVTGIRRDTLALVAADPDSLSGKARKARAYGVPVIGEDAFGPLIDAIAPLDGSAPTLPAARHAASGHSEAGYSPPVDASITASANPSPAGSWVHAAGHSLDIRVELSAPPVLSYAMAHNQIPVIDELTLINSAGAIDGAVVEIAVADGDGRLSHRCQRLVDIDADGRAKLTDLNLRLDPAAMLQINEKRPGTISVTVESAGTVIGEHVGNVSLLAARQWLSDPPGLAMELLAAFVMPNDPAIEALINDASALLDKSTGSPSIQGYQSGTERVDQIAKAIFEAAQARGIRYSEPPASWSDIGQKVRAPAEVLEGHVGTCLDTTVVLAAALEQAGIRPLLWLVEGHAFLGYWRDEASLDSIVQTDVHDVVNYIDLGLIQLIETTLVTAREEAAAFSETHRPPYATYLTGDLSQVFGVIDVWTARKNSIIPLPARRQVDSGVQVIEYRAAEHSAPAPNRPAPDEDGERRKATTGPVPPRVQQWKNALLDLSLRNRLINFTDRASVHITVPDKHLGSIEDLVNSKRALSLLPADQIDEVHIQRGVRSGAELPDAQLADLLAQRSAVFTDVFRASYSTRMRGLAYKARTIVEETGANNLYLALGSLLWSFEGRQIRSPLILIPVRLVAASRTHAYRLELDESGASTPNFCLLEKLKQTHGLDVPGLAEPDQDEAGIDLDAALESVRIAIAKNGLPFRVEATADLSILQFAKFRLWKDLDEHWERLVSNSLVKHLIDSPTEPFEDPCPLADTPVDLDELDAKCPVPADASQLHAIADACTGRTFVLEGPPGTGKSQTITNLLTRAIADGKRVLFVAEKRAALDVVFNRLDSVGMRPFSLDLHDKGSRPATVRRQIKAALDHAVTVDEQGLVAQEEDLRSARRSLSRYAQRLHERNKVGMSYYSARTSLIALGEDHDTLAVPESFVSSSQADRVGTVRRALTVLPDTADLARPQADHPWGFVRGIDTDQDNFDQLRSAARSVDDAVSALPMAGPLSDVVRSVRSPAELGTLVGLLEADTAPLSVLDETRTSHWREESSALSGAIAAFIAAAHPGLDRATPSALDLPLADIHARAQAAAASGFFGRAKRLKTVLAELAPALRQDAAIRPKEVPALTAALVQLQGAVSALTSRAASVPGIHTPSAWNPLTPEGRQVVERQIEWLTWAGGAVDTSASGDSKFTWSIRSYLASAPLVDRGVVPAVRAAHEALANLVVCAGGDNAAMVQWSDRDGFVDQWTRTASSRSLEDPALPDVRRWVSFLEALRPIADAGLGRAHAQLLAGTVDAEDAVRAFDRGLSTASLRERRVSTGLDAFEATTHDRTVSRFSDAAESVRRQMATAVPNEILQARPFQASAGRGQVGALQRELAKQRRGLGVRALLETYGELITQVMPCVLVSPDSVSRFFPVGSQVFDIVVFDEASQIRVADAIGAMGRAKSVVVVGDSKQMPPTTFAEPKSGFDDDLTAPEPTVVEDEESILTESVLARVPQRWLSWHYRSQDESLIAFSNHHYYEDRLSSFPAPISSGTNARHDGYGVSMVRVDGQFQRSGKGRLLRTNPIEADAIVAEIRRRFDASPNVMPSLGVVTFNQQQRAHIEGLLRDSGDDRLVEALDGTNGEGLFVKNLENVQGDERDVILFSTAFSANERGVLPLNFGPLTRGGGERRLNVAVTRARRQVIMFTSFDPGDLRDNDTQSIGVKHLRRYLDMAATGSSDLEHTSTSRVAPTDRHCDEVAARLRQRGLVVDTNVGLSDFKVDLTIALPEDPCRPLVAVLLDGEGWAKRHTVGDRDGLPVQVLSKLLHWPAVERVWLPSWLADRDAIVDHLETAARRAHDDDRYDAAEDVSAPIYTATEEAAVASSDPISLAGTPIELVDITGASQDAEPTLEGAGLVAEVRSVPVHTERPLTRLPGESDFIPWAVRSLGAREVLDSLPDPISGLRVRKALETVVAAEGPIHLDRLGRRVAAAFDLTRVNSSRMVSIIDQLPVALRSSDGEPFAWPTSIDAATWTGFRRARESEPRQVEQISVRELGNAMVALCRDAAGMFREELLREVLAFFGGRRLTPGIQERLDHAATTTLTVGRLVQQPSGVLVVSAG